MDRRALIIGIDQYDHVGQLNGCVNDALKIKDVLSRHEDGRPNYDCRDYVSGEDNYITRSFMRDKWRELFEGYRGDALFYFAGHGHLLDKKGYLVTTEGNKNDPGLPMNDLVDLANRSDARSVLLILDCCFAGSAGNDGWLTGTGDYDISEIREGVTILAATAPTTVATENDQSGVFTHLLCTALTGAAADVRGRVSAAGIYAYAEQILGTWDQRPIYKSHASSLNPVRLCEPAVSDELLRQLPKLFPEKAWKHQMLPSYEHTHHSAKVEHVAIFDAFKALRNARLLTTEDNKDLYFTALDSGHAMLTRHGQFYWELAKRGRI